MENVTLGSKEEFIVDIKDTLENISDLTTTNPRYDVKDKDGGFKMTNQIAVVDPVNKMRLHCLIDTTVGTWPPGRYDLYVRFASAPEAPQSGPFQFKVNP